MARLHVLSRVAFALFFIGAGINHFVNPQFYLKIIPPYLPAHDALNAISGAAEVLLGALVLPARTRRLASWGSIALLLAVFPANVYVYQQHETLFPGVPHGLHLLRLPLQGVLIYWAFRVGRARS